MAWPAWSIDERPGLARYVMPEVADRFRIDIVRDDAIARGDRLAVVRAIYDTLQKCDFHYSREIWAPRDGPQVIRHPNDIFRGGNATCLDLALLFAGVCLGHELLPLVVVIEGHAFAAVSLLDDPRRADSLARVERDGCWIKDGVLQEVSVFAKLIAENGHYLPIECTGFAKTEELADDVPEGRGRKDGRLSFEAAIAAARAQYTERSFLFAVDPALRQRVKMVAPYESPPAVEEVVKKMRPLFDESHIERQEAQEREFEENYLKQVAKKYGRVETLGVRDLKEFRQPLTLAYVSLFVKQSETGGEVGRRQADYVLRSQPLLTVRASAGAGKTTLLNWIALACAQGADPDTNALWHGGVPFFVPLRTLKGGGTPDLSRLVDYTIDHKQWPTTVPPNWIVKILEGRRGVIMLDGVDELPSSARAEFWRWVKDVLMESYPGNRILITSRYLPESRATNWQPPPGFASANLDEMTDNDVTEFIRRWHEGALENETDAGVIAGLEQARDALPIKLIDPVNHRVRELCGTPLLCSLICALHWREEGYLPGQRIDLYERCVDMLIEERDRKRGIEPPAEPLRWITKDDKEMLLQRLAYQMMKNVMTGEARIEVSKDQAERWIGGWRPHFEDKRARESKPSEVLEHLIERTGLLREPESSTIEYAHRSFQEYLAACAAGAADEAGELANRADNDQWHEIIILASGTRTGGIPFGRRVILALLERGERVLGTKTGGGISLGMWFRAFLQRAAEPDLRQICFALAVACLETAKQPDPEISARVLGHLTDIVPPRNAAAAKHLSAAGEAALPFLCYDTWKGESEEIVASCARAVRLIGGALATKFLFDEYGGDERESVLVEVARGPRINVLDLPAIRKRLSTQKSIPFQLHDFVKDLIPIAALQGLDSLDLSWCSAVKDLTPLAAVTTIRRLSLTGCSSITDLTPLAALQSLEWLRLSHCEDIIDLGPLAALTGLRELNLVRSNGIRSFAPLASLQSLKVLLLGGHLRTPELPALGKLDTLYLFECSGITNIAPLISRQSSLTTLFLSECNEITDLSPLTATKVQRLYLVGCTGITNLGPLAALQQSLVMLDISGCTAIVDLNPLAEFKLLSDIYVDQAQFDQLPSILKSRTNVKIEIRK